jgi:hypothetical protein
MCGIMHPLLTQVEICDEHGRSALQLLTKSFVDLNLWITDEQEEALGGAEKVTELFMAAILRMVRTYVGPGVASFMVFPTGELCAVLFCFG